MKAPGTAASGRLGRPLWVRLHRWLGLATAGFLFVVGLTGSLLAFYPELQRLANPHWYRDRPAATWLSPGELAARAEQADPRIRVTQLQLQGFEGATRAWVQARSAPAGGRAPDLAFDYLVLDPASAEVIDRGRWGGIGDGWRQVVDFVYELHYSLALGMAGVWLLGAVALAWTLDCFIGAYLTLPGARRPTRGFWSRWWPAWQVKRGAGTYRLNHDLHRAGGLWPWAMLLVFAWSSVYMNLWDTVYTWATRAVLDFRPPWVLQAPLPEPVAAPALGWREAQARAERLMAEQAARHGLVPGRPISLQYDADTGSYTYQVTSDLDIADRPRRYAAQVIFDGRDGALQHVLLPRGQHAGNTVSNWLYALHMANVFGLPYRMLVSTLGLTIAALSVTGVVVWWHKWRARRHRLRRVANAATPASKRPGPRRPST